MIVGARAVGVVLWRLSTTCQEIWAGSPATESLVSGVESSSLDPSDGNAEHVDSTITDDEGDDETGLLETRSQDETELLKTQSQDVDEAIDLLKCPSPEKSHEEKPEEEENTQNEPTRSEKMSTFLKERRHKKVGKKIPKVSTEQQLLDVSQSIYRTTTPGCFPKYLPNNNSWMFPKVSTEQQLLDVSQSIYRTTTPGCFKRRVCVQQTTFFEHG